MNKKYSKFPFFIFLSLLSAFVFEEIPRVTQNLLPSSSAPHLWEAGGAGPFVFIIVWYSVIFSIAFFLFRNRSINYAVSFGIIIGMIAETFLFQKMNIVSFFLFPVLYGLMFYLPFKIRHIMIYEEKIERRQVVTVLGLIIFVIAVLTLTASL